jgi:hypothetical protein
LSNLVSGGLQSTVFPVAFPAPVYMRHL